MHVQLVVLFMDRLLLGELGVINTHHLLAHRGRSTGEVIVIAPGSEVLSPSLRYYRVLASLQAIDRAAIDIFVANLYTPVRMGIPCVVVAMIIL